MDLIKPITEEIQAITRRKRDPLGLIGFLFCQGYRIGI